MKELKCSIIMPAYNVGKYIYRSLQSAVSQTERYIEIIVVNDGSTDDTEAKANEFVMVDSRVRVISQRNQGSGIARNTGLKVAKGKYVYFMDPDDVIESNLISDIVAMAESTNADVAIFGFWTEYFDAEGNLVKRVPAKIEMSGVYSGNEYHDILPKYISDPMNVWNRIYKREFLQKNNCLFKSYSMGQDVAFNCLVNSKPIGVVAVSGERYYHYIVRNNSAVGRYHQIKFDTPFYLADEYLRMTKQLGKANDPAYQKMVNFQYIRDFNVGLKNVCLPSSGKSNREILEWIHRTLRNKHFEEALRNVPYDCFIFRKERIKIRLLKMRAFMLLIVLQKRNISKNTPKW